jgi:thymidylate kinase
LELELELEFSEPMAADKANAQATARRPFLITFSGIDGAGKTTQIEKVSSCLEKQGLRVLRLSFWDHVAVWSKMRAGAGHWPVDSHPAERTDQRSFAPKNSKHIRKWYLTAVRLGFYLLDVARLQRLVASPFLRNADVVIFDRYSYDQVANLDSQSLAARAYCKILLKLTPAPDLAFILDASPTAAFARKPEYPLEFMRQNRENFLRLGRLVPRLIIICDARMEDVTDEIYLHIGRSQLAVASRGPASSEEKPELTLDDAVVPLQGSCRVRNDPTANL